MEISKTNNLDQASAKENNFMLGDSADTLFIKV